jgi:hypothetical protein
MYKFVNSRNLAIFLCVLFLALHYYIKTFIYWNWTNVLGWDILSYYIYLPFTFIYHDPGMVNQLVLDRIFEQYHPSGTLYQIFKLPNGNWVPMYSMGFAILFSPFFFIAHLWAMMSNVYPADGFSYPYQYCIGNGVMIYIVAGIFVIRKVLLAFFSDGVTMFTMIFLLLGTNYFHEASSDECMPHAMLFTAYALILWLTIKWHQKPTVRTAALLGLLIGFTIIARGSAIVCLFIPVLWNVYDKRSLITKWNIIKTHRLHLIGGVGCMLIIPFCQFIYWKYITGSFLFDSYQNTEGFDWDGQHIFKVLFSYRKSWFIYTPIIIQPIIGIWLMRKKAHQIYFAIVVFFLANFYLISGWAAWWQGGSFGMRYFVESYAIMSIPFGYFVKTIIETRKIVKGIIFSIAFFLTFLNLFQTWQFNRMMIDGYAMTKAYYWRIFLKTYATEEDRKLLDVQRGNFSFNEVFNDYSNYTEKIIGYYDYDSNNSTSVDPVFRDSSFYVSPPYSCRLTSDRIYSPTLRIPFCVITKREHAWLRVSLDYYYDDTLACILEPASLVMNFEHGKHNYKYKGWNLVRDSGENKWNHFSVDYLTPIPLSTDDLMITYVYLKGKANVYIDNYQVQAFERKW